MGAETDKQHHGHGHATPLDASARGGADTPGRAGTMTMEHGEHGPHGAGMEHPHGHSAAMAAPGAMGHAGHGGMENAGHGGMGGHMGHMGNLKRKFWVSLALAVPILLLSPMMGLRLPFQVSFPGSGLLALLLSTVLYFYGGMPFLRGAVDELRRKSPAMMTLIALGITTAYVYSVYAFTVNRLGSGGARVMDFFWELATLIVIMLLGHWVEMNAVANAGDAVQKMAELLPSTASVKQPDGSFAQVPLRDVREGQTVMVRAGERVPADGVVVEGETSVNEALVTGEAREVPKKAGDTVIGGSQNGPGGVLVTVTGTGESGYLAKVMRLVEGARSEKSHAETLSDKVARWLFYVALAAGLGALAAWYAVTGDFGTALTRMVTVLVIACPHALGLAIPLVTARSTSLGARNGLLVRTRRALEKGARVTVVLMDKTGTLTEGNFTVTEASPLVPDMSGDEVLALAGGLETGSSHPLAAGVMRSLKDKGIAPAAVENIRTLPGTGLSGSLADGREAKIVNAAYLDKTGAAYDHDAYASLSGKGYSVSFLLLDERPAGLVALGDTVKPGAREAVRQLKARGVSPVMLTGDNAAAAGKVSSQLGLDGYRAGLLPQDKEALVTEYRDKGEVVMMVGDGINDAPSLARADVGVAIGAGTDVAIDSADVVLVRSDPADIPHFLSLAVNTTRKMVQNLWWGAGYNIVAIPLAAGVLAPAGIILSPAVGAVLMSLSTVIVAVNAMTLKIR